MSTPDREQQQQVHLAFDRHRDVPEWEVVSAPIYCETLQIVISRNAPKWWAAWRIGRLRRRALKADARNRHTWEAEHGD